MINIDKIEEYTQKIEELKKQNEKLMETLTCYLEKDQEKDLETITTIKSIVLNYNQKEKSILKCVIFVIGIILIIIYLF